MGVAFGRGYMNESAVAALATMTHTHLPHRRRALSPVTA